MIKQLRHSDRCLPDRVCRKGSDTQIWLVPVCVFVAQIRGEVLTAGCVMQAPGTSSHVLYSGSECAWCGLCSWCWVTGKVLLHSSPNSFLSSPVFLFLSSITLVFWLLTVSFLYFRKCVLVSVKAFDLAEIKSH